MNYTRRNFIRALGSAAAFPAIVRGRGRTRQLPLAFSTLGCPKWPWKTVLEQASQLGYAAIELRGIEGDMDLPQRPEFADARLKQSLRDLDALNLKISDLGSSARMHEKDPAKRKAQLDDGRSFIDLAHKLRSPYVRVFGDKWVEGESREDTLRRVTEGLRELRQHAEGSGVGVIIESHGDFTDSAILEEILKRGGIDLLWDAHHTFVAGKEEPSYTFQRLGRFVRHTHLKDSVPKGADHHYVLTGQGTVPVKETVRVLVRGGYRGYYCFEWEKAWHPDIDEPEIAFPHYAKVMREYLAEAGVKS
jgi:sugar phosphate isomerase/epimerase